MEGEIKMAKEKCSVCNEESDNWRHVPEVTTEKVKYAIVCVACIVKEK